MADIIVYLPSFEEMMTGAGMIAQNIQPAVCLSSPILAVILLTHYDFL